MAMVRNGYASAFGTDQGTGVPGVTAPNYYADPNVGPIAENIGSLLFGNPQMQQQRALAQSELARNRAATDGQTLQNDQLRGQNTARGGIGALFDAASHVTLPDGTKRASTADEFRSNSAPFVQGLINSSNDPAVGANIGRLLAGYFGNTAVQGMADRGPGAPFSQTSTGQTQSEDAHYRTNTAVAGIGAGSAANVANIQNRGMMDRQTQGQLFGRENQPPVVVGPGQTIVPMANGSDPRFPDGKPFQGVPTEDGVRAKATQTFLNPSLPTPLTPQQVDDRSRQVAVPGVVVSEGNNATSLANNTANNVRAVANAKLVTDGRISVADAQAEERFQAALLRGDTQISVADRAAASRVEVARQAALGRTDAATIITNGKAGPTLAPAQIEAFAKDVQNTLADLKLSVTSEAKQEIQTRAAAYYEGHGDAKLKRDTQGSIAAAIHDMKADGSLTDAPRGIGNLFGLTGEQGLAPGRAAGSQGIVPSSPTNPATSAPSRGAMPGEGGTIEQNGKSYIIRNGQAVPTL
jgi:hypothetical protein